MPLLIKSKSNKLRHSPHQHALKFAAVTYNQNCLKLLLKRKCVLTVIALRHFNFILESILYSKRHLLEIKCNLTKHGNAWGVERTGTLGK